MSPAEFKKIREQMGLTQAELGELLGLSGRIPIAHYETGFRNPSHLTAALMRIFNEWPEKKSVELRYELKRQMDRLYKKSRNKS